MKPKFNIPQRGKSNPPGKNLPPSTVLEEETKKMEQRLRELKDVMAQESAKREQLGSQQSNSTSGSRWRSANDTVPIKNYAKAVLENKIRPPSSGKKNKENVSSQDKVGPPSASGSATKMTISTSALLAEPKPAAATLKTSSSITSTPQNMKATNGKSVDTSTVSISSTGTTTNAPTGIEANLKKALASQKANSEVDNWLIQLGLNQYIGVFKENGFDDMDILADVSTKHLVEMKIPAGHQIKIMKNIEKLRQTSNPTPKLSEMGVTTGTETTSTAATKSNVKISSARPKSDLIELEAPTKETAIGDDNPIIQQKGGDLLNGRFDEAESHKSFLEALEEYRKGGKTTTTTDTATTKTDAASSKRPESKSNARPESKNKSVRFSEDTQDNEGSRDIHYISSKQLKKKDKNFLWGGGDNWNMGEYPASKEHATSTETNSVPITHSTRKSCWSCYSLFYEEQSYKVEDKIYCNEDCYKNYLLVNSVECGGKDCKKQILKPDAIIREGRWFCSENCAPSKEEILLQEQRAMAEAIAISQENSNVRASKELKSTAPVSTKKEAKAPVKEELKQDHSPDLENDFDLDLNMGKKTAMPTLEELEAKYKELNEKKVQPQIQIQVQNQPAPQPTKARKIPQRATNKSSSNNIKLDDSLDN
jgi:hypothetical protein